MGGRAAAWDDAWRIHEMFPNFGTGFNTYGSATVLYQRNDLAAHYVEAHNDYLQILVEGGVIVAGLDRLRQGYGGSPRPFGKAKSPASSARPQPSWRAERVTTT